MKIYKYGTTICCRVYFFHLNFTCFLSHRLLFPYSFVFWNVHHRFFVPYCTLDSASTYDIHHYVCIEKNHIACKKEPCADYEAIRELPFIYCPRPTRSRNSFNKFFIFFTPVFSMARTSCEEKRGKIYAIIWRHKKWNIDNILQNMHHSALCYIAFEIPQKYPPLKLRSIIGFKNSLRVLIVWTICYIVNYIPHIFIGNNLNCTNFF